jgi:dipeptidyl-peptidase-4
MGMGAFSLDALGSTLSNFGAQAGAMLAGMNLPEEGEEGSGNGNGAAAAAAEAAAAEAAAAGKAFLQASASPLSSSSPPLQQAGAPAAAAGSPRPTPPLIVTLPAADGVTPLFAALFLPDAAVHGPGPYPTVVAVYGGPHVQRVKHDWATSNEGRAQALRRDGFLVAMVDNRGSSRRGLAFEGALRHALGRVEVEDQVAAVRALVAARLAQADRVGVYGWSYGGYMTLLLLARAPGVFAAGVSGAPVTSWDGYDTGYTERYMGTPGGNPEGYAAASVLTQAAAITGRLLLVHGLLDENVHARHSLRLIARLIAANVLYDFLPFPAERHVPRGVADKAYREARIRDFFRRHLLGPR